MIASDLVYIYPELTLMLMGCLILVTALILQKVSRWIPYLLSQAALVLFLWLTWNLAGQPAQSLFDNHFIFDNMGSTIKIVIALYAIPAFMYARKYVWEHEIAGVEYFVLCL